MSLPPKLGLNFTTSGPSTRLSAVPPSTSAIVAESEKTITALEDENRSLKAELVELRSLYKQLTFEGNQETFDERRVTLLKSQVIQLERQILLLTEALESRTSVLMEAENSLAAGTEFCRASLGHKDGSRQTRIDHEDLEKLIATLESARKKLFSSNEKTSDMSNLERPLLWFGDFIRNKSSKRVTLFDICRGGIEHLNLKHVGRLESKLVQLYKNLKLVDSSLRICVHNSSRATMLSDAPTVVYGNLCNNITRSFDQLQDVCPLLLQLSLLVPAAPLPAINCTSIPAVTVDNVLQAFGKGPGRVREVKPIVEALVKSVNYSVNVAGCEQTLLMDELEFHRAVYGFQSDYIDSLFACIRDSYLAFENELQAEICQPLQEVTSAFGKLKESSNEKSLLEFIGIFRNQSPALLEIVKKLSAPDIFDCGEMEKKRQFSEYSEDLVRRLDRQRTECRKKRDARIAEIDIVRRKLEEQTKKLSEMIGRSQAASKETDNISTQCRPPPSADSCRNSDDLVSNQHCSGEQQLKTCKSPTGTIEGRNKSSQSSRTLGSPTWTPRPMPVRRSYSIIPGVPQQSLKLRAIRKPKTGTDQTPESNSPTETKMMSSHRSSSLRTIDGPLSTDLSSKVAKAGRQQNSTSQESSIDDVKHFRPATTPTSLTMKRSSSLQSVQQKSRTSSNDSLKNRPPFWLPNDPDT